MAMQGYTKLFNSILASTIWSEPDHIRIIWITMLAMADKDGMVSASIPGLATLARISVERCEEALGVLSSPDKYSRTREFDGRRIKEADGGWQLLNYEKYKRKLSAEERKEYLAAKQREYRARNKQVSTNVDNVSDTDTKLTHSDSDSDSDAEAVKQTYASVPLGSSEFKTFFAGYPIQTGRKAALHEWCKQRLDSLAGEVMLSLSRWKACERWQDPQYIPYPGKWLADQWKSEPVKGVSKHEQKRQTTKQAIERVRASMGE